MGRESYDLGKTGEEIAAQYLLQRGYQVLEKNFRSQQGEIDIIARENNFLVFVEVKSYSFRSLTSPLSAIRQGKRQSIIHAARTYLYIKRLAQVDCRFDVVAIYGRPDGSRGIDLYKNAFMVC